MLKLIWRATPERVQFIRDHAHDMTAREMQRELGAPTVKHIYDAAQAHNIFLTASRRGGPTLAHDFTSEQIGNLIFVATKRGLSRHEAFKKICDAVMSGSDARDLMLNLIDEGPGQ